MYRLRVEPIIFTKFPTYKVGLIYAKGLENGYSDSYSTTILREAERAARLAFGEEKAASHPHIVAWREAYKEFGAKPSKYPCSVEALLSRVLKGNDLPNINRIVDIYNAISLKYVMPVGGEDWDKLESDLVLKVSAGNEPFVSIQEGAPASVMPTSGEIVWADRLGATCRMWNWRQCLRTQITEQTGNVYFVLDTIGSYPAEKLEAASAELVGHLRQISPNAEITTEFLP